MVDAYCVAYRRDHCSSEARASWNIQSGQSSRYALRRCKCGRRRRRGIVLSQVRKLPIGLQRECFDPRIRCRATTLPGAPDSIGSSVLPVLHEDAWLRVLYVTGFVDALMSLHTAYVCFANSYSPCVWMHVQGAGTPGTPGLAFQSLQPQKATPPEACRATRGDLTPPHFRPRRHLPHRRRVVLSRSVLSAVSSATRLYSTRAAAWVRQVEKTL